MRITQTILGVLIAFICWDIITTYYGTISIFRGTGRFFEVLADTPFEIQIVAIMFSIGLITFILSYKHILRANNLITKGLLFVAFVYDFATSIFGTYSLVSTVSITSVPAQGAIIFLLAGMSTASPLLIHQIME